jgi:hypothetical protein
MEQAARHGRPETRFHGTYHPRVPLQARMIPPENDSIEEMLH